MDNELLQEIHIVNNHSPATVRIYDQAVKKYTKFFSMSLEELLEEAEEEEGIRWKKRKLKRILLTFRQHLLENYSLNSVKTIFSSILYIYNYEIEVLEIPKIKFIFYTIQNF